MSTLDVSIRAKFVNQIRAGAKQAAADLKGVKDAAAQMGQGGGAQKLGAELEKASGKAKVAKKDIQEVRKEAGQLGATTVSAKFLTTMRAEAKAATVEIRGVKNAAQQLGTGNGAGRLAGDLGKASGGAKAAKRDVQELRSEVDRLGSTRGGSVAAAEIEKVGRAAKVAKKEMQAAHSGNGSGVHPAGQGEGAEGGMAPAALAGAIGARAFAPLALALAAKKAFDQSVGWDAAWAEVKKKVNDADEGQFQELAKTISRLSLELGIGRVELAGLTAEAGAAGIAYADLEKFMVLTGKAANGWDMDPREASEKLAYTKAAMGYTLAEMDAIANKINALGDNSAAKERDILEMFLRVGSAAKEAGVNADASLAILTGVRAGGMEPEVTARWFGALTGGLRTAAIAPKRVQKGLQMLGLDAKKVAKGMKDDAVGTLLDLFARLEKSPKAVEAATQIFGKEWWDETMRAKGGLTEIKKQLDFIRNPGNWQGSLDKGFAIQQATAKAHLTKLNELVSRVGVGLANWSLGPFNSAVDAAVAKMQELENRASWWERWSAYYSAKAKADGTIADPPKAEEQGPPVPDSIGGDAFQRFSARTRKMLFGDERTGDVLLGQWMSDLGEWFFGEKGAKGAQVWEAAKSGRDAAQAEKEAGIRGLIEQRQRLAKMIDNPAYPDQEGMKHRAGAIDERLKAALGSAELGPIARKVMEEYAAAIQAEGTKATAEAQRIAAQLMQILSITARPQIDMPMPAAVPGRGGAASPPASSAPAGQKQSSAGPVIHQHIYGGDSARVAQLARREQERGIRSARAGALHDIGSWA